MSRWTSAGVLCLLLASGCGETRRATETKFGDSASSSEFAADAERITPALASAVVQPRDALDDVKVLNSPRFPLPPADFEPGTASPLEFDAEAIQTTERGFTIQMPSASPIPTPTVHRGRLYVGGGFSSKEFYCFDAVSGAFQWGASLSDDGPSAAVACGDSIIFNSESCTLFALEAATGKLRWAHYLGDPMMAAPSVADGRVFTVYPESIEAVEQSGNQRVGEAKQAATLRPTYIVACLDAESGRVLWRRWIDGDCISAPVCDGDGLYLATLPGTLYRFRAADGIILGAWHARATSAPTLAEDTMFFTRRTDAKGSAPSEAIVGFNPKSSLVSLVAMNRPAPYLDRVVQEASAATMSANRAESLNGIGGGFGGGFNSVPDHISLADDSDAPPFQHDKGEAPQAAMPGEQESGDAMDHLAIQQQQAADNVGLGNVSTLQAFHGSRVVHVAGRNYNCMGDELLCSSAASGERLWSIKLSGNLEELGGHLAAPPVWSNGELFVATVVGDVLEVDAGQGEIKARHAIGSQLRFPPVVAEGRLYVSTQDGKVVCVRLGAD
jgi:outer membrane protein assembly factor BamB